MRISVVEGGSLHGIGVLWCLVVGFVGWTYIG